MNASANRSWAVWFKMPARSCSPVPSSTASSAPPFFTWCGRTSAYPNPTVAEVQFHRQLQHDDPDIIIRSTVPRQIKVNLQRGRTKRRHFHIFFFFCMRQASFWASSCWCWPSSVCSCSSHSMIKLTTNPWPWPKSMSPDWPSIAWPLYPSWSACSR